MSSPTASSTAPAPVFVLPVVAAAGLSHLLNDLIQALLPAIYPMLKTQFALNFSQIGLIALAYQVTASLFQPWIGFYTDKHPLPWLLPGGMVLTLTGIGMLATAGSFPMLIVAACVVGLGSATFHPEASRVARMGSGGRFGTAQSIFQVGGNTGSAIGPLLAAVLVYPAASRQLPGSCWQPCWPLWCCGSCHAGACAMARRRSASWRAGSHRRWNALPWSAPSR